MTKTRIFTILMLPVVGVLIFAVYNSIFGRINEQKAIERSENRVIEQLKMIRDAELAYQTRYKSFTASWDTLATFIETDTIFTIEKREIIKPRTPDDPLYYTRTDSIRIEYDTIAREWAKEKLFPAEKYPKFNAANLKFIAGKEGKEFELWAEKQKRKGGIMVDLVECVDKHPRDPRRNDDNQSPTRWYLRFGSRTEATTSGNWE